MAVYITGYMDNMLAQTAISNAREHEVTRERLVSCEETVSKVTENFKFVQDAMDSRYSAIESSMSSLTPRFMANESVPQFWPWLLYA